MSQVLENEALADARKKIKWRMVEDIDWL